MADSTGGMVKLALIGGAAWVAYEYLFGNLFKTTAPTTAPTSGQPGAPVAPPAPPLGTTLGVTGANSLDGIHQQLVKAANAPSAGLSVDGWGYFLNQVLANAGKGAAPDPMPIFQPAIPGFDRGQLLTDAQYWGIMAPALKSQLGLSGLGLYGSLGALGWRARLGY